MGGKEYNYIYNEGSLIEAITYSIELNGEIVVGKTILNTLRYVYDDEGKQTKKILTLSDGTEQVYLAADESNSTSEFIVGDNSIKTHSKTDSFGRKIFDEFQLGSGFISRQFSYHAGEETREHKKNEKLMSSPTTQLVSEILLSDGRTLSYEYDAEERITSVTESYKTADNKTVTNITEYTYDALGQLLTETVNGSVVNSMKYDNYGNIVSKNGKEYCYDDTWHDLLRSYDGYEIEYDAQGNPTSYLGHTLTWEKGRQLKSFDGNTYTYNANGIRTSKTVNGVKHTYTLDGTKILRETWNGNTLIPLYDNEDGVCGILYNSVPYYFIKNLQGDIIAIVDQWADTVARYSYDAWGVCTVTQDSSCCQIAAINPFRYRGYYYDEEIDLYYLQSRYYDANVGRFVNGDAPEVILRVAEDNQIYWGNYFVYCSNAPTIYIDMSGKWLARLITGAIGAAAFAALAYLVCKIVKLFVPISNKIVAAVVAGCALLGGILGAAFGPSFLAKHTPNLLKTINRIEKQRFSIKTFGPNKNGNIIGFNISKVLNIMLHAPHLDQPPKEWAFHIQVEAGLPNKYGKIATVTLLWLPIVYVNYSNWISILKKLGLMH